MKRLLFAIVLILSCIANARAQVDSLFFDLEGTVFTEQRNTSPIEGNMMTKIEFTPESIKSMPKMLGQIDPMRFAQSMPGVVTNSEFSGGLVIQGCDNYQTSFTIAGAPVYIAPRMLGFFPIINADHYEKMSLSTRSKGNYLGGMLTYEPADTIPSRVTGNGSLGLISSQATLSVPFSSKLALSASARTSYINLVYGDVLQMEGAALRYSFSDFNTTLLWRPDSRNIIDFNGYYGTDLANADAMMLLTTSGTWSQGMGTLRWRHKGKVPQTHQVFVSDHRKYYDIELAMLHANMPSHMTEYGYKSEIKLPLDFNVNLQASYYDVQPQDPYVAELQTLSSERQAPQSAIRGLAGLDKCFRAGPFKADLILDAIAYRDLATDHTYLSLDPGVELEWNLYNAGKLTLCAGRKHQYMLQTGYMSSGIPMMFWLMGGKYSEPQESHFAELSHSVSLGHGAFTLSTQMYYKQLYNQLEFNGFLQTIITQSYNLKDVLVPVNGQNFGGNVMLSKNSGAVTGWVSYSWGRALRHSDRPDYPDTFPSSAERPHEFDTVVSWKINDSFDVGGTFVLASGTPYTPVKYYYVMSDCIMAEYYDYNSGRLAPYLRLDLSANWNIRRTGRFRDGINVSVFNATGRTNELMYSMKLHSGNTFCYRPVRMIIKVIPSLSYFCKF